MIIKYGDHSPHIDRDAWVERDGTVCGDVTIVAGTRIMHGARLVAGAATQHALGVVSSSDRTAPISAPVGLSQAAGSACSVCAGVRVRPSPFCATALLASPPPATMAVGGQSAGKDRHIRFASSRFGLPSSPLAARGP